LGLDLHHPHSPDRCHLADLSAGAALGGLMLR